MRALQMIDLRRISTLLVLSLVLLPAVAAAEKPNIVIILADDFGVGDIQAHYPDNKIATPCLDTFVRESLSFTDAHTPSAVCSPTRYGLLTGRYCWRTRLQEWVIAAYEPPLIANDTVTMPGFLKQHGYRTSLIGKWHLGWEWDGPQPARMTEVRNGQKHLEWDFSKPMRGGPVDRGFDYFFGVDLPNMPPFTFFENDRLATQPTAKYELDPSEGIVLPRGFVGCPMAPGWKMDRILPEITERAVRQVHELAEQDEPFFLLFSMTSPHEPIVPSTDFRDKSGIAPIADFVMETDWSAGQVIKAVDDAGIADNTIVIFTADNGHSHYTGWEDLIDAGHMPSGQYRGHKGDIWEGGHRVPFVVRWPNRIAANASSEQLVCLTDIFATAAEIIGHELPKQSAEDSFSFAAACFGEAGDMARPNLISHSNVGEFAYREGPWKIVFKMGRRNLNESRGEPTITELYNLEDDVAESNNLVKQESDLAVQLTERLRESIERGATHPQREGSNDAHVDFEVTQELRWAPARQQ